MTRLFEQTGHDSDDERNTEARRYVSELVDVKGRMEPKERKFIMDMSDRMEADSFRCTGPQLYWLRDLYQKYCH